MESNPKKKMRLLDEEVLGQKEAEEVYVVKFAENRAEEITSLENEMKTSKSNKRFFQSLPKHMRRRAMSHNVKRLPRRLQHIAKKELQKIGISTAKRPSRKYRRRPSKIFKNYASRQKNFVWLETHIWHAKRFKMESLWGYKIPVHANDKSIRATYRAAVDHALLQDISFYICLELCGPQQVLLDGLANLTNSETGLTFAAKSYLSGIRQGCVVLYHSKSYPQGAIGPVHFLWKPLSDGQKRHLWLWCHPSCFDEIVSEFKEIFILEYIKTDPKSSDSTIPKLPHYSNSVVTLILLKDSLVKLRLTGPKSHGILMDALHPAHIIINKNGLPLSEKTWWEKFYSNEIHQKELEDQKCYWEKLRLLYMASELPAGSIMALTVRDPRVFIPEIKVQIDLNVVTEGIEEVTPSLSTSASPLWNELVRDEVTTSKMTQHEFNKRRQDLLVPGSQLKLGREENLIPILLISNGGYQFNSFLNTDRKFLGFGNGWDILLPQSWAMPFWISLVYRGARVGGLRDSASLGKELGIPYFPNDYVDTKACIDYTKLLKNQLETKYQRIPPAKKPNYYKLGVVLPFQFSWMSLVEEWDVLATKDENLKGLLKEKNVKVTQVDGYHVIRNKKLLRNLNQFCDKSVNKKKSNTSSHSSQNNFCENVPLRGLITVQLTMCLRGICSKFSMICLPSNKDLEELKKNSSYSGPLEPKHKDLHSKRKTKKGKSKEQEKKENIQTCTIQSIVTSCSRQLIGFVTSGGYAYSEGKAIGVGLCSLKGFMKLLSENRNSSLLVLIRNPTSFQYRFCRLIVHV